MRRLCLMLALVGLLTLSASASEYVIVPDTVLSPVLVEYGEGLARKVPFGSHYVFWGSDNAFYFAVSPELSYNGSRFVGSNVTVFQLVYASGSAVPSWTSYVSEDFAVSPGDMPAWSDLGAYPTLIDREGKDYAQTACIILCSFGLFYLFSRLRSYFGGRR